MRIAALAVVAGIAIVAGPIACGPSATPQQDADLPRNTNSPIVGATLRCAQDYPDSALVFAPDGTLSGRYAGQEVSGEWNALAPERVEVVVRAGAIAVRDTVRRAGSGWYADNTACG